MTRPNESTDRATIFAKWPDGTGCYFPCFDDADGVTLEERVEYVRKFAACNGVAGFVPVAWVSETEWNDDDSRWEALRAESIAAGRVIKLIDGKYVAFGVAQGEPIAPTFYCAAETIKPACENCAGCSKCNPAHMAEARSRVLALLKAKGRGAAEALLATFGVERLSQLDKGQCETFVLTADYLLGRTTNAEKVRPRLTWADSKPFDAFKDFSSSSDTATPDHAYSHYLTRVADAGAQVSAQHGSAHILPKA